MNQTELQEYVKAQEALSTAIESLDKLVSLARCSRANKGLGAFRKASRAAKDARSIVAQAVEERQGGTRWRVTEPASWRDKECFASTYLAAKAHFRAEINSSELSPADRLRLINSLELRGIPPQTTRRVSARRALAPKSEQPEPEKPPQEEAREVATGTMNGLPVSIVALPAKAKARAFNPYVFTYKNSAGYTKFHGTFADQRRSTGMTRLELAQALRTQTDVIRGLEEGKYETDWKSLERFIRDTLMANKKPVHIDTTTGALCGAKTEKRLATPVRATCKKCLALYPVEFKR